MRNTEYYCLSHATDFYSSAVLLSLGSQSGSGIAPAPFRPLSFDLPLGFYPGQGRRWTFAPRSAEPAR
eukprot:8225892-Pyramimonas_sp.AAC.1